MMAGLDLDLGLDVSRFGLKQCSKIRQLFKIWNVANPLNFQNFDKIQ
jgi:hypothetical protein